MARCSCSRRSWELVSARQSAPTLRQRSSADTSARGSPNACGWRDDFVRALVVAGVGAGIASTYFAQLSAAFFAFEVVLGGVGGPIFVIPTLIAVVASTLVTGSLGTQSPRYATPAGAELWGGTLLVYRRGRAARHARGDHLRQLAAPDHGSVWGRVALPYWARPAIAGLLVGVVGIWLPDVFGTGLTR